MGDDGLELVALMQWALTEGPPFPRKTFERIVHKWGVTDAEARTGLVDDIAVAFDQQLREDVDHVAKFTKTPDARNAQTKSEVIDRYREYRRFASYKTQLQDKMKSLRSASRTTLFDKLDFTFEQLCEAENNECSRVMRSLTNISIYLRGKYENVWTEHGLRQSQEPSWWHSSTCKEELENKLQGLHESNFHGISDGDLRETMKTLREIALATQDSEAPKSFKVLRQFLPQMTKLIASRLAQGPPELSNMYSYDSLVVSETLYESLDESLDEIWDE